MNIWVNKSGFDASYIFVVSGVTIIPTAGATYTNNSKAFTVLGCKITAGSGYVFCTGTGAPTTSGTLTKASGTGDSTIVFSALALTGTTPTLAKLTIAGGNSLVATLNDTITVGDGFYNERMGIGTITAGTTNVYADGIVIVDGTGLAGTGAGCVLLAGDPGTINLGVLSTGGKWIFQNHNPTSDNIGCIRAISGGHVATMTISGVTIIGNTNNTCGITPEVNSNNIYLIVTNCMIYNCSAYGINMTTSNYGKVLNPVTYNTFYGCAIGIGYLNSTSMTFNGPVTHNIFHTVTTAINWVATLPYIVDYNTYYNFTNIYNNNGTLYTTLAATRAQNMDQNSSVADPQLVDPANGIFTPKAAVANNSGAYLYSPVTYGAAYNPDSKWTINSVGDSSGWYNASGNISLNGSNYFILTSGSSDTVASPVWDLGTAKSIQKISVFGQETYPTNVIDTDITDVAPNYATVEVRASNSVFTQTAGSPAWIIIPREGTSMTLNQWNINGRYLQIRLTLRQNGAAA